MSSKHLLTGQYVLVTGPDNYYLMVGRIEDVTEGKVLVSTWVNAQDVVLLLSATTADQSTLKAQWEQGRLP